MWRCIHRTPKERKRRAAPSPYVTYSERTDPSTATAVVSPRGATIRPNDGLNGHRTARSEAECRGTL
jgi:hypothetical protein